MNKARRKALDEVISKIEEANRKTSRALRGMRRQTPPWTT